MADETHAAWNYGRTYPLLLNIVFPGGAKFLAVEFVDRDHARMRLVADIEAASQPDVMSSPETKLFSRTAD